MGWSNNGHFIPSNAHSVYDSFLHYQGDELQILQVGPLSGEQLLSDEVSLVSRKSLQTKHTELIFYNVRMWVYILLKK